ncbi:MAG: hypothetical protein IPK53_09370 [bacterium]|nr:hypothetical protein [bacterium]
MADATAIFLAGWCGGAVSAEEGPMTLSRTEEIRQVASEWEFDKRIHAPAPPDCSGAVA